MFRPPKLTNWSSHKQVLFQAAASQLRSFPQLPAAASNPNPSSIESVGGPRIEARRSWARPRHGGGGEREVGR